MDEGPMPMMWGSRLVMAQLMYLLSMQRPRLLVRLLRIRMTPTMPLVILEALPAVMRPGAHCRKAGLTLRATRQWFLAVGPSSVQRMVSWRLPCLRSWEIEMAWISASNLPVCWGSSTRWCESAAYSSIFAREMQAWPFSEVVGRSHLHIFTSTAFTLWQGIGVALAKMASVIAFHFLAVFVGWNPLINLGDTLIDMFD